MCLKFPAYKFEDLQDAPAELWTAFRLLSIADRTNAGKH